MPAKRGSSITLRCLISEKKTELERLVQADVLELRASRKRFGDVAAIEGAAEAHVGRALRGHGGPLHPANAIMGAMRRFMVTIEESNWEDVEDVELPELPREGDTFETKYGTCIVMHAELLSDGGQYGGKIVCRLP